MAREKIANMLVEEVLRDFPPLGIWAVIELGNHGGFSGTRLWRLRGSEGEYCLRAWPGEVEADYLDWTHGLLARAAVAGLAFVPRMVPARGGRTFVEHAGRCWEMQTWLEGEADFARSPSGARIEAACAALGELHQAWAEEGRSGPCPGIERRLEAAKKWLELCGSGWRPVASADDPLGPLVARAWPLVSERIPFLPAVLAPWCEVRLARQPCLCDPWHDHLLFTGERVGGLIDYGSVKVDHVAVDVARLLGSLAGEEKRLWRAGMESYGRVRLLSAEEERLVSVLDETGVVLGVANWLRWLFHEKRNFEDRAAVGRRLGELVARLERAPSAGR